MIYVVHGLFVYIVYVNLNFVRRNLLLLHILHDKLTSFIRWCIVNVDNMIVFIVLHENRVEVSQVKSGFNIFVRRNQDTKSEFVVSVLAQLIKGLIIELLILHNFLDGPFLFLQSFIKGRKLDLNLSFKVDVMHKLCSNNCSHVLFQRYLKNCLTIPVHFIQVRIQYHVVDGNRKMVKMLSHVLWNRTVRNHNLQSCNVL